MNWYVKVLKNYAVFTGRARRKEYWMFALFNFIVGSLLMVIDNMQGMVNEWGQGLLGSIYGLAVLIPAIACAVRRLHDTGRNGLWFLIGFVPCVGVIVLLVFFVEDGNAGPKRIWPRPQDKRSRSVDVTSAIQSRHRTLVAWPFVSNMIFKDTGHAPLTQNAVSSDYLRLEQ